MRYLPLHRYLTGQVVPGSRVIVTGIYSTYAPAKNKTTSGAPALRQPYVRILGLELDTSLAAGGGGLKNFTPAEEEEFLRLSRSDDLYERFARSVAPSIFGSLGKQQRVSAAFSIHRANDRDATDIKKAITCLLFGGSKKILPDGMRLRGDINVLLLGDPGTAKSQLLKFVEKASRLNANGMRWIWLLTAIVRRSRPSRFILLERVRRRLV